MMMKPNSNNLRKNHKCHGVKDHVPIFCMWVVLHLNKLHNLIDCRVNSNGEEKKHDDTIIHFECFQVPLFVFLNFIHDPEDHIEN